MTLLRTTLHWLNRGDRSWYLLALVVMIVCVAFLSACSNDDGEDGLGGPGPTQTASSLTLAGWSFYEYGDHEGA